MALGDLAAKGQAKLNRKATSMAASYAASLGRAAANYRGVGFGPTRTSNYEQGIRDGAAQYAPGLSRGLSKWATNWQAKMSE